MNNRSDESYNAEEIVNMRVENYRSKAKLESYDRIAEKCENYQQFMTKLIYVLNNRFTTIHKLIANLGIKTSNKFQKDIAELKSIKMSKQGEKGIQINYERLSYELDVQQELLSTANECVIELVRDHHELKVKYEEMFNVHSRCDEISAISSEKLEKLKQLEKEARIKDESIHQLTKINQSLEEELKTNRVKQIQNTKRIQELEAQLQNLSKQAHIHRQVYQQSIENSKQKQRILNNCEKLLEIITIPNDDYLKYYFRSNGLPMQPQRQQKNKYSIVFDN